ncbi:hypothetical protein LWF15_33275 [Kineosporia rhizophila]|uniref:hypothetical protein n=1 Tax=Kineosporia rhizophila TaxID=84633 RepID=UPI001E5C1ADE|nr:hypothetical protein [Kineosporia rhizophila]MCE0540377.1 hypothetical protein [Kineosporia rhizophila]
MGDDRSGNWDYHELCGIFLNAERGCSADSPNAEGRGSAMADLERRMIMVEEVLGLEDGVVTAPEGSLIAVVRSHSRILEVQQDHLAELRQGQHRVQDEVTGLRIDVRELKVGQDELRADVRELKTDVQVLKTDVQVLKTDVQVLKTDVQVLKTDVQVLKTDVQDLKTDVQVLKTDVQDLKAGQEELKIGQAEIRAEQVEMKAEIGGLKADTQRIIGMITDLAMRVAPGRE